MSEIELNMKMVKMCQVLGHDPEYYAPIHGLCFTCKSVNPEYYN